MRDWINWIAVGTPIYIAGAVAGSNSPDNLTIHIIVGVCGIISMAIYDSVN